MKRRKIEPLHSHHMKEVEESWRRERPDLDLADFLLTIYLIRIGRMLDDSYDRMCQRTYGISGADMRVLFALRRAGIPYARRPTELFRALLVTSGAMTKQVDRLSAANLVERRRHPGPSAGVLIWLTKRGLKVADEAAESIAERSLTREATNSMTAEERAAGESFCQRLSFALESLVSKDGVDETEKAWDLPRKVVRSRTRRPAKPA
jgi:DNA-binding MarR family transcriptional regulator